MSKTFIIAEMAYSHDGSVDLAKDIVKKAKIAGADAISLHFTDMPSYMVPHYGSGPGRVSAGKDTKPVYDYLCEISLSFDAWREVVQEARVNALKVVVMPNDLASFEFAETVEPDAYVLSAACFEEETFIRVIGGSGRPLYLRVGGATLGEIETVIGWLKDVNTDHITLLYGHQNYPTSIADTNLSYLPLLQQTFDLPVGLADHVDAEDEFAAIVPLLSLPLGATCIEKHLTHDRSLKGEDHESALNVDELTLLVKRVRKAERAMGPNNLSGLAAASTAYRAIVRKRVVSARDIKVGEILDDTALICKRADEGAAPSQLSFFHGQRARVDISVHHGVTPNMVEPND